MTHMHQASAGYQVQIDIEEQQHEDELYQTYIEQWRRHLSGQTELGFLG